MLQPRILDEYSDPFDVKKEIEQTSKDEDTVKSETQFLNATQDTPQASEDDYSVPYELTNFPAHEGDFEHLQPSIYTVNHKKRATLFLIITLAFLG